MAVPFSVAKETVTVRTLGADRRTTKTALVVPEFPSTTRASEIVRDGSGTTLSGTGTENSEVLPAGSVAVAVTLPRRIDGFRKSGETKPTFPDASVTTVR